MSRSINNKLAKIDFRSLMKYATADNEFQMNQEKIQSQCKRSNQTQNLKNVREGIGKSLNGSSFGVCFENNLPSFERKTDFFGICFSQQFI